MEVGGGGLKAMEVGGGGSKVAVFIQVIGGKEDLWYRVEVEENTFIAKDKRRKVVRKRISPVAALCLERYGYGGSWDVIGDDIYLVGGNTLNNHKFHVSNELLKHNICSDPRVWETVSTGMKLPRTSPILTAVGENKLYVLLGTQLGSSDDGDDYDDD